jgi:mannose-1-phosphate guanylyltransferase
MSGSAGLHVVVLAGGKGTRFWPKSRERRPKQLLPILSERTMAQETVARLGLVVEHANVWVVTGEAHAEELRAQLPEVPVEQVVAEPIGRNTAPAIGLAAELIAARDPHATMIVLPADHHVRDGERFREVLRRAVSLARRENALVTIGIAPEAPETGYGYIERGAEIPGGHRVRRFTEKPDRARAEEFLASGRYLWNAGIFVWRVDVIRAALRSHLPETADALREIVARWGDGERFAAAYAAVDAVSIDYGVLEKADNVAVVTGDFGWDDIGSWAAVRRLRRADGEGNVLEGRVVALSSARNYVSGGNRLVALLGVENLVVVDTDDALLVCAADRVQDVKQIVDELERRGWKKEI